MEFRRLFDIPLHQKLQYPQKAMLSERNSIAKKVYSTQNCLEECMKVTAGALDLGLERGDKVAIISKHSSAKWIFLDIGLIQAGIVPVTIHPEWDDETLGQILDEINVKLAIVEDREQHSKLKDINANLKKINKVFTFEELPDIPSWSDFITVPLPHHHERYETSKAGIHEDDIATIVYTGGISGKPKGVVLSHQNMVSSILSLAEALPLNATHTVVSFLPQVHIFERIAVYTYMAVGCKINFLRNADTLLDELCAIRPNYFTCSPSILLGFYENIMKRGIKQSKGIKSRYIWALKLGRQYKDYGKLSIPYYMKLRIADFLVFRHWRKAFGGRIEGILLGDDANPASFARLFSAAGIDVRSAYCMAETSGIISLSGFGISGVNFETVGKPLEGVEIKISEPKDKYGNGEIWIRGNHIMKGYWNGEESKVMTNQGDWLKTGDVGRLSEKKEHLQIAGRIEDVIDLENGSQVNPLFIENQIKDSPYFENSLVVANDKTHLVALIVPSFINIHIWCLQKNISVEEAKEEALLQNEEIKELFRKEIQRINEKLSKQEKIVKFRVLKQKWTKETKELNHYNKLRRTFVEKKYADLVLEMYGG